MLDEEAKAAQEIAKTTGKAVDAASKLGQFFARFVAGPAEQASGIVTDHLKFLRWERQVRLKRRMEEIMDEHGISEPTRRVPMKVAVPILEAASMEEEDELQDIWARLFVNAADAASGVEVSHSLITILKDFGSLEARILGTIYAVSPEQRAEGVRTLLLPGAIPDTPQDAALVLPPPEVQLALWNLIRLGCITAAGTWGGGQNVGQVFLTALGEALVRACTSKAKAAE